MKTLKTGLFCIVISITSLTFAQDEGGRWSTEGNDAEPGFFIGTTNHEDLIFKTNNLEGFRLNYDGAVQIMNDLEIKSLEDPSLSEDRFLTIQTGGKVSSITQGNLITSILRKECWVDPNGGSPQINAVWTQKPNAGYGILYTGSGGCGGTRVGIGTHNPLAPLHVTGKGLFGSIEAGANGIRVMSPDVGVHKAYSVVNRATTKDVFRVMNSGHVWCTELDIKLNEDFPDYVFATNYNLMPLDELENYITKNKHLPNIPSAEEVAKDGLSVGAMQVKQMEKIEEITLYLIELKKELDTVKKENAELKQLVLQK